MAKEMASTDEEFIDNKIAELQIQIDSGSLGFKAEKVFFLFS